MRLREYQAKEILTEEIADVGGGYEVGLVRTDGPRAAANELSWWYEGNVEDEGSITRRTLAYLRAYVRIGGDLGMQAQGLLLDRGRVHMDKYVMRRLHKDGFVAFVKAPAAFFDLTDDGRRLIADGI
ncbi:MAG: hypothetical protein JWO65_1900 [Sphingomonas bacterium]|nr:hypothetical protein [Sphingomonas bacterium]